MIWSKDTQDSHASSKSNHPSYIAAGVKNDWGKILHFQHGEWSVLHGNNNFSYHDVDRVKDGSDPLQIAVGYRVNQGEIHGQKDWQEMSLSPQKFNRLHFFSVACAFSKNCWAVGQIDPAGPEKKHGVFYRYTKTGWHLEETAPRGVAITHIDCPSATTCYAVGSLGYLFEYHAQHKRWTIAIHNHPDSFERVSCPKLNFCYLMSKRGKIYTYHHQQLSLVFQNQTVPSLEDIDCLSRDFCMVVGHQGTIILFNGKQWKIHQLKEAPHFKSIRCRSPQNCMAIALNHHQSFHYAHGYWHTHELGGRYSLYQIRSPSRSRSSNIIQTS